MSIYAKVIACSESALTGVRVTTLEVRFHRFVLAELNTHRVFSRNSASSRAIPTKKRIEMVLNDPAEPIEWGRNQAGMQAGESLTADDSAACRQEWLAASREAVNRAKRMADRKAHKQVVNRVLEPYLWHTAVITSTDWAGWKLQRLHAKAQPEIRKLAEAIESTLVDASLRPAWSVRLGRGDWHLPYVLAEERRAFGHGDLVKISSARCARVSYKPFDSDGADPEKDLALYRKLTDHPPEDPMHGSPLEHVCTPATEEERPQGNLRGWHQLRHLVELDRALNLKELL